MNEELERVEIKVSYLEAQVAELNEVIIEQQKKQPEDLAECTN